MKKILIAVALAGMSSTAAADALIYAGANVGQASIDSDKSTVFGAHVGTGILPFIGIEAGYQKLGDASVGSVNIEASTIYVAAKPSIDVGPIQVYAKAGFHSWSQQISSASSDDTGTDLMYGFGAEYYLIDNLSVGASWTQFKMGGNTADVNSDQLALTATFHFL
ncbi:porin family protein [Vibrio tapetis subsp. quintayensis]|uniref:porin family protein n=1 Tax=Vibrio tapetis TaxID=52443 RepID=UPI0025B3FB99|nr:porin family protein [Vibrio tapetis]MDN3682550.1 porin family protein [Vibrio tapetis subsp. quintayensis]